MDRQSEIRFKELSAIAKSRMDLAAHTPNAVFAEIHYMTREELVEFMDLRNKLPSFGQMALDAKARIAEKIKKRNFNKSIQ